ncbi:MAG TPA: carboxypeptidase-like regulatory domain-containing protein [Thermoanaerobaculia bacterium]|nr:carboxypeptidase-like regulatory domain-containing protein [Thermoanaerobaculia bacterium]
MRLFLQDGPARLQILSPSHTRHFRDVAAAREFLRPLIGQAGNAIAIRRVLEPDTIVRDAELLDELARRVVDEGLLVVSCADTYLTSIQGTLTESSAAASSAAAASSSAAATTPLQDEEAAQAASAGATEAAAEETHFIEVELKDEEGKPVPNASYFVELPDGSTKSGRTDANGYARIDGVDPGTAKISFPDFDQDSTTPGGG